MANALLENALVAVSPDVAVQIQFNWGFMAEEDCLEVFLIISKEEEDRVVFVVVVVEDGMIDRINILSRGKYMCYDGGHRMSPPEIPYDEKKIES
jgi:hypothetical protein